MEGGWIKLHRKMLENAIFYKPEYYQVWSYILLKVNHKEVSMIWNNEKKVLKKGAGIFSQKDMAKIFKIEISKVNRILNFLKNENQISFIGFNKYTEIQVINWEEYQEAIENGNQKETKKKPRGNPEETDKNDNNENKLKEECFLFLDKYGKEMIDAFLLNWTEKDNKGRQKWKLEKTWETGLRLAKWRANEIKWAKPIFDKTQKSNGPGGLIV